MRFIFTCGLIYLSGLIFAQDCDSTKWAQPGTYSVEIDSLAVESDSQATILLSGDDLCYIEACRKPTQAVQIRLGAYLVTVFPAKKFADNTTEE